jgi:sulfatase maturation enzyme AslB (radical SAM superfamily)
MYFTGGEPLINPEHWNLLEHLIDIGRANSITLMYNTNLTTLKYKQKNIIDIWKQFKNVTISCSIDAIGKPLEYIRSGADWKKINTHIEQLISTTKDSSIKIAITPVISILNIWFLEELIIFAKQRNIEVNPNILTGPDYLSIDVMPDFLKELALEKILSIAKHQTIPTTIIKQLMEMIKNNASQQCLFQHTVSHILLLDNLRDEKLFNLLPFNEVSINNILRNREYE